MEKIFVIKGTNLTIHMPKELDHHNAEEIKREADRLLGTRNIRSIIFDFEKTSFMDSSGIGMIMGVTKHPLSRGNGAGGTGQRAHPPDSDSLRRLQVHRYL